jgi:hypothetical protein
MAARTFSELYELASVVVRLDPVASVVIYTNHRIM